MISDHFRRKKQTKGDHIMKLKRSVILILIAVVVISLLSGCGTGKTEIYDEGYTAGFNSAVEMITHTEDVSDDASGSDVVPDLGDFDYEKIGFVMVTDVIPDAILEMRYYSTFNFVGERIDGYESPVALLTEEAATALKNVNNDLMKQGYRIKIYDAYRPQAAVDHFRSWAKDLDDTEMKEYFYPELDKSVLFKQGYIASKSGHSRGSTVDLTIVDMKTGIDVDMGSGFDYFGEVSHPNAAAGLTQEQINNRKILREAMIRHGFRPISTEWWHFTLNNEPYPDTYFDFPVTMPEQ